MGTFTNRFKVDAELAINQVHVLLERCENCEYKLKGFHVQYRKDTYEFHELVYIRKEGDKIYILGVPLKDGEEYDYEIDELSYENLGYIVDEISTI